MNDEINKDYIENIPFDELTVGRKATLTRTLSERDILLFANSSGDLNPMHLDEEYARNNMFHGIVAHGMWVGSLISAALGNVMPGLGTVYLGQELKFRAPVKPGDRVTVELTVKSKREDKPIVTIDCKCVNQDGVAVVEGVATVLVLTEKVRWPKPEMPEVEILSEDYPCQTCNKTSVGNPS